MRLVCFSPVVQFVQSADNIECVGMNHLVWVVSVHGVVYTVWCTLYSVKRIVHSKVYSTGILYSVQFTLYSAQCTAQSVQFTMYVVLSTIYSVWCTVYSVQCT